MQQQMQTTMGYVIFLASLDRLMMDTKEKSPIGSFLSWNPLRVSISTLIQCLDCDSARLNSNGLCFCTKMKSQADDEVFNLYRVHLKKRSDTLSIELRIPDT